MYAMVNSHVSDPDQGTGKTTGVGAALWLHTAPSVSVYDGSNAEDPFLHENQ